MGDSEVVRSGYLHYFLSAGRLRAVLDAKVVQISFTLEKEFDVVEYQYEILN